MNEEERPLGGQDERAPAQAPEQLTEPVNLERTAPIGNYPPPTGSPFVYQSPPPVERSPLASSPTSGHSPERSSLKGPGGGAIAARGEGALAVAMAAARVGGIGGALLVNRVDRGGASLA